MASEDTKAPTTRLDELHGDLVGSSATLTDLDRIINILEVLADKVEEIEGHSHSIS